MKPEDTIRNLVKAANKHDLKAIAEAYAPGAIAQDPGYPKPLKGREAILKDYEVFFVKGMPDAKFRIISIMSKGNKVAVEFEFGGTHAGPLETPEGTIQATNKQVNFRIGIFYVRFNTKGQIAEERRHYDMAGVMRQLGLMK